MVENSGYEASLAGEVVRLGKRVETLEGQLTLMARMVFPLSQALRDYAQGIPTFSEVAKEGIDPAYDGPVSMSPLSPTRERVLAAARAIYQVLPVGSVMSRGEIGRKIRSRRWQEPISAADANFALAEMAKEGFLEVQRVAPEGGKGKPTRWYRRVK